MASNSPLSPIKPPALHTGDKVGIVAPASNIKRELLERGCEALRSLGYEPFYFDSILERDLYFAGTVERRAAGLEKMFERDDVGALVCARGGCVFNKHLYALSFREGDADPATFFCSHCA